MEENNQIVKAVTSRTLLFAYIPNYRCLSGIGLNFDAHFKFSYNITNKILSTHYDAYFPNNFWADNITSVSVIAGKNGAGKSSALRWILERIVEGNSIDALKGILIWRENNIIKIYHDIEITNEIHIDGFRIESYDTSNWDSLQLREKLKTPVVFDTGHFDIYHELIPTDGELAGERNISDKWLLIHDITAYKNIDSNGLNNSIGDHLKAYRIQNDLRICKLLLDPRFQSTFEKNGSPAIKLPKYIIFTPNTSGDENIRNRLVFLKQRIEKEGRSEYGNKSQRQYNLLKKISEIAYNTGIEEYEMKNEKGVLSSFLFTSLLNFYFSISHFEFFSDRILNYLTLFFTDYYKNENEGVLAYLNKVNSELSKAPRISKFQNQSNDGQNLEYVKRFFNSLTAVIKYLSEEVEWINGIPLIDCTRTIYDSTFEPSGEAMQLYATSFPKDITRTGKKLVDLLNSEIYTTERFFDLHYSHTLDISSSLSSGELGLLNLYSRIKYAFDAEMPGGVSSKPTMLLLDEVEISFHPEWQRQFLDRLTKFVSLIAEGSDSVQIIYTTHSPITLSDMPSQCINLLDSALSMSHEVKNSMESFGSNVFDLYGNQFFMEDGLIGEFAKSKILLLNDEIESLRPENVGDDLDAKYKALLYRINMIGDVRIRNYLTSRLDKKHPLGEIERLEARINELRNRTLNNAEN